MNILMMTNTYLPHVGGVARSVSAFTNEYRRLGHRVIVVAPEFEGMPEEEQDVIRMPAIQNFNGSDFSVALPVPGILELALADFTPDIVHSHHPFLIGGTAVRVANMFNVPLVFTHHTMYERYTHYVPGDSPRMREFAINLSRGYCNLCDHVFAPSESVAGMLRERGVTTEITSLPTGVDVEKFAQGDGPGMRSRLEIPADALVVGHLGRLAPEKNLEFLARAVARFMKNRDDAWFLVIGDGPSRDEIVRIFDEAGLGERLCMAGTLKDQDLIDGYHAMDVFVFASQTETQGMVLTEAMAAGVPVIAVDASGTREVVRDGGNGRLLGEEDEEAFAAALEWFADLSPDAREQCREAARRTADEFSMSNCAERALAVYHRVCLLEMQRRPAELTFWESAIEQLKAEWNLMMNVAEAAAGAAAASLETESEDVIHD